MLRCRKAMSNELRTGKASLIPLIRSSVIPNFLDVMLKFLDVIVVKREEKYKNIGSFTPKDRIFLYKTSDLFMQKVKENKFYLKLCEYLLKLFQHLPLYQTKESPALLRARDKTCFL